MPPARASLPALTSLRFFAALAIFAVHAWSGLQVVTATGPTIVPAAAHLTTGVTFFFVLSGFILTYNYLDALRRPTARGVWNFYVARWARIYPVHLLACLPLLPLTYKSLLRGVFGEPVGLIAAHLTLVQAFLRDQVLGPTAFNPPAWSLSAEWFFYLCFPLVIPALTTGSFARRAAALLLCLAPWAAAVAGLLGAPSLWAAAGRDPYFFPPVRLADFLVGVLLGLCWHHRGGVARPNAALATLVEVAALVFCAAWAWACVRYAVTPKGIAAFRWAGLYLPPFALLVWVFARGGGLVSRLLAVRPLVYLGEISYAFYMLHYPVLIYAVHRCQRIGFNEWAWGWKWLATGSLALALSAACYHLYELPLRDWLKRRLSLRKAAPAEAPAVAPTVEALPLPTPAAPRRAA